jgi:signal transduction histidine kinase
MQNYFVSQIAEFFTNNFIAVFFVYGLAFFVMGLAILLEIGHASELDFAHSLTLLAGFGLVHGIHEWFEMFLLIYGRSTADPDNAWIFPICLAFLAVSFLLLVAFGARTISGPANPRAFLALFCAILIVWGIGFLLVLNIRGDLQSRQIAADVYTRYSLGIPGAALAVWGLLRQRQRFIQMQMSSFGLDVTLAALSFGLYGGIGQLFASPSTVFPSAYLNAENFLQWFGFPIQVFRALMAASAALFITRSLRAFQVENRRRLTSMQEEQLATSRRLEQVRGELLHRTVKALESERQRIARELHDETGQTLTAIGMGLHALKGSIDTNPQRAVQQANTIETLATNGILDLQRVVSGLHPPQLDDFGLVAALRWYARDCSERFRIPITIRLNGNIPNLNPEIRTVLYRIAQEAITNTIRHAQASMITVLLDCDERHLILAIEDDGCGFNVEAAMDKKSSQPSWGLIGMIERAELINGDCQIISNSGRGTIIQVVLPLAHEV